MSSRPGTSEMPARGLNALPFTGLLQKRSRGRSAFTVLTGYNWKSRRVELAKLGQLLNLVYYDGETQKGNCIIHGVKVLDNIDQYANCFAITNSSRLNWGDEASVVIFSASSDQEQSKWVTLINECLEDLGEAKKSKPAAAPATAPAPAPAPDPEGVASIGRRGTAAERLFASTEEAAAEMETEESGGNGEVDARAEGDEGGGGGEEQDKANDDGTWENRNSKA